MIVPALDKSKAKAWLEARLEGVKPSGDPHEIGVLPRGDVQSALETARAGLEKLANQLDGESERLRVRRFDAEGSAILHGALGELPLRVASDRDFWRYVACGPLFDLVRWRYPNQDTPANFALGGKFESMPEQLWFRAHVVYWPDHDDPYTLARRGGIDFWVSGNIRHLFGAVPVVARALVEFQYPAPGHFDEQGSYEPRTLTLDGFRELFKRLRHFTAINELSALDEAAARDLVCHLGSELRSAYAADDRE